MHPSHTKPSFTKYNILTVHNIVLQHVLTFMHKIYNKTAPLEIQSHFSVADKIKIVNTRKTRKVINLLLTVSNKIH